MMSFSKDLACHDLVELVTDYLDYALPPLQPPLRGASAPLVGRASQLRTLAEYLAHDAATLVKPTPSYRAAVQAPRLARTWLVWRVSSSSSSDHSDSGTTRVQPRGPTTIGTPIGACRS